MSLLRKLLRQPIKDTLIVFCIGLLSFSILALISTYVTRIDMRNYAIGIEDNYFLLISRLIVWEMVFISKLILEFSFLVLIAQTIYRLKERSSSIK